MKKLSKFLLVLTAIAFATNTYSEELGLKMANLSLNSYSSPAAKGKSKGSGDGIERGLIQLDASFNLGSHGPVAKRRGYYGYYGSARAGVAFSPGFTINVDGAVHPYASVGGYFGFNGGIGTLKGYYAIGIGVRGVFHIYQLIADKAHTKVSPGDLDFYLPFHMGGTVILWKGGHSGGFAVGSGIGLRYYFTKNIGIMTEVGWNEISVAKVGLAVKL